MYDAVKKILNEGGKCLLIENGKPVGVVLTLEEYEKLLGGKAEVKTEIKKEETPAVAASVPEIKPAEFAASENITLDDLDLDELPY